MKQIIKECEISTLDNQDSVFQASNPNGYKLMQKWKQLLRQNGFIIITLIEEGSLPTFLYDPRIKETSYEFKGKSGTQLSNFLTFSIIYLLSLAMRIYLRLVLI